MIKLGKIEGILRNVRSKNYSLYAMDKYFHKRNDIGVDLNRNYDFEFGKDNEGSSGYKCSDDYRGVSSKFI